MKKVPAAPVLLSVRQLRVEFASRGLLWRRQAQLPALDGLSFDLAAGEILAVVGESGSGKSTLARTLMGLQAATAGSLSYRGQELRGLGKKQWRPLRRHIQMVFQDPAASFNPRRRIGQALAEPLQALRPELDAAERTRRVAAMLERVGLSAADAQRRPQEFSGGQAQRLAIARALIVEPELLVCDEPVSALDVSVQAQIINLLLELKRERGLTLLFIAHDLPLVRHVADRVLVLYYGRLMEQAAVETLFAYPRHPYTRALLAAIPDSGVDAQCRALDGERPAPGMPGCLFTARCPMADEQCARRPPPSRRFAGNSLAACHYAREDVPA
ncbi:oligopeptide transport system ATP-binding protein [Solimonas aquatica]|uniref:Oligopeptide transport system ATP-binding protein n=1 Tax=Solimonas aquatica TaxID=489703 RepID=A0A1H9JYK8_9GAMM|nr:oligopeptide/dipeptide ABC transporter ATP-binding protein [Solimonas aquatica]SEQ91888.1 oligopeptide transport system ATP-binding protein [Solimonas aquatica]